MKRRPVKASNVGLALALLACARLAGAQSAESASTPNDTNRDGLQIEQITVTARKVEENLQDVPLAISAFSGRDLEKLGIVDPQEIGNFTPGLLYEKDFGRRFDRPVIRGQSNILGTPNAATFIDGVFIPDSLFSTELAFVDRVEVIKGPQSALYGRQTFSGAISYITKTPSDEQEGELRLRVAEDEEFDVLGVLSGPIVSDRLYYQIGANYYSYGGQYRNDAPGDPSDGREIGDEETVALSGKLLFTPSADLDVTVRFSYSDNDDGHEVTALQDSTFNNCFLNVGRQYFCGEVDVGPDVIGLNLDAVDSGGILRETYRGAVTLNYDFANGYEITSISGYNDSLEERKFDADFQNFAGFLGLLHVNDMVDVQSFSQEIRLASPQDRRFRWLAGIYYYDETRDEDRFRFATDQLLDNAENETRNFAAFGFVSYDFSDRLKATAEVRVAEDRLRLVGGPAALELQETFTEVNPRFTLGYDINEALLLYAVAARGNKPGGFNSDQRLPGDLVAFDEEISWNYELGLKTSLLDNRVQLNLSGYYIDWEDQQLTQNFLPAAGTPFSFVDNAGTLDVYGAEIEATARLTRDWTLRTSYAYTDPEFSGGTDAEVGTLFGDDSLVGRRPPNVSEHQFSVISDYTFDLTGDWSAFIVADYAFRSSKFAQVINEAESGDRGVANLRAGVNNESYEIILFVRNVFDNTDPVSVTRYIDSRNFLGSPFVTNRGFLAGIPRERQFGAEVRLRF